MTTLAPRRKPVFARRGRHARHLRVLGLAAAAVFVASMAFSMGVKVGANSETPPTLKSIIAANTP